MDDDKQPAQSPPSSGSPPQSQQSSVALDSPSASDLVAALKGVERDLRSVIRRLESIERVVGMTDTRTARMENAQQIDSRRVAAMRIESAAALSRIEVATSALQAGTSEAEKAVRVLREASGEFITHVADKDEISARHIKLRWSTVASWAHIVGKIVGAIGFGAAAAYGAFKAFIQRFTE
jgi:hypothetical protein